LQTANEPLRIVSESLGIFIRLPCDQLPRSA
jgi:hypothetical protein